MELEETLYWLDIAVRSELIRAEKVVALQREAEELIAIFVSLINKWKR